MNFDELTRFLEKRVQKSMPGADAQLKMKPRMANGAPLRMKHATPPRKGGVLILLFPDNDVVRFALIQRPDYEGIHGGQMALPGGRYEEEDKDQIQTALRESEEEIGVDKSKIEIIGSLSEFFVAASNYMVLPVIGKMNFKPTFVPEPREVDDIVTPPLKDLINPSRLKEKEIVVRSGYKLICPYFDLQGRTVWGATAMMLGELVEILKEFEQSR
ncbi:NUDIX domain-containing protein [Ekhidna lutea]|uniref:NUDIX domain-containing protein n=1 Tax=Ekhidna lutea TaxID=447679 RepID=A0A239LY29_EKHLU|nr:CoA pyrophosphatase [Ekhidna lutea]SNT34872.1 NUDIX domain-containing protein [Ekhidna lutea]